MQFANSNKNLAQLVREGKISEETLDETVRRILRIKFELGLFDESYVEPKKALKTVRCDEHRRLAEECARKSMTLLRNNGILPLRIEEVKRIGVYGPAANTLNVGDYSGGRGGWRGEGGVTPYEGLKKALQGKAEVVLNAAGQDVDPLAATCDVLLFFPSITEEEGSDRSSFFLPSANMERNREQTGAIIIADQQENKIRIDQERMVRDLIATGKPVVVVLHNGAVVDISQWIDGTAAVLEAWYPGEQGGTAIADVLTGKYNPGGRLPMSWVRSIGQNPMYYSIKPSGRGYGYVENDGKPLFPFGYGLSYTTFEYNDLQIPQTLEKDGTLRISVNVTNTGEREGDEVVQVYIHDVLASVARPMKELAAFKRVTLAAGETKKVELEVPYRRFCMWDADMNFRVEEGEFDIWLGRNAEQRIAGKKVYVK